jgi:hypothetical protein
MWVPLQPRRDPRAPRDLIRTCAGAMMGRVPHNFIRINADEPNPGRVTKTKVSQIVKKHGKLKGFWFDDDRDPVFAYVLVLMDDDRKLGRLLIELHGQQLTRLFDPNEVAPPKVSAPTRAQPPARSRSPRR